MSKAWIKRGAGAKVIAPKTSGFWRVTAPGATSTVIAIKLLQ